MTIMQLRLLAIIIIIIIRKRIHVVVKNDKNAHALLAHTHSSAHSSNSRRTSWNIHTAVIRILLIVNVVLA